MRQKKNIILIQAMVESRFAPIAIANLKAYALKDADIHKTYEIQLLSPSLSEFAPEAIASMCAGMKPEIVGFSTYVWSKRICADAVQAVRRECPDAFIIFGGPESCAEDLEEAGAPDIVIIGEGERAFADILSKRMSGRDWRDTRGIAWRCGDTVRTNPPQTLIENLDDIPSPYLTNILNPNGLKQIEYNRGCIYHCSFCSNAASKYRSYSLQRFEEEFRDCVNRGIPIKLTAGSFLNAKGFGVNLLSTMLRTGVEVKGNAFIDGNIYDARFMHLLGQVNKSKGTLWFEMGIQCCDETTMKLNHRVNNFHNMLKNLKHLNKLEIPTVLDVMIGLPGDNLLRVAQTLATAAWMKPEKIPCAPVMALQHTKLRDQCNAFGIDVDKAHSTVVKEMNGFPQRELSKAHLMAQSLKIEYEARRYKYG